MRLLESLAVSRFRGSSSGDLIVQRDQKIAVVDIVTPKHLLRSRQSAIDLVADLMSRVLDDLAEDSNMADVAKTASGLVAREKRRPDASLARDGAFVVAVLHGPGRWVGRCGDVMVLVDGQVPWPERPRPERIAASQRAQIITAELESGTSVSELQERDPGREAILPLLRRIAEHRNRHGVYGHAAIDGTPIPDALIDQATIPHGTVEVVLATDGYPTVHETLEASELALADRLKKDPLLVDEHPQTKGLRAGANSFDDRAYVRVEL